MRIRIFILMILYLSSVQGDCGNGVLEPGEVCDDGNRVAGDGCSVDCASVETGFHCNHYLLQPSERSICCPSETTVANPYNVTERVCGPCDADMHESGLFYISASCERIDVNECADPNVCDDSGVKHLVCVNEDGTNAATDDAVGYGCECVETGVWSLACDGFRYAAYFRVFAENISQVERQWESAFLDAVQQIVNEEPFFDDPAHQVSIDYTENHTPTQRRLLNTRATSISFFIDFTKLIYTEHFVSIVNVEELLRILQDDPAMKNVMLIDDLQTVIIDSDDAGVLNNQTRLTNPNQASLSVISASTTPSTWEIVLRSASNIKLFFVSKSSLWTNGSVDNSLTAHPCLYTRDICCLHRSLEHFEYGSVGRDTINTIVSVDASMTCEVQPLFIHILNERQKDSYYSLQTTMSDIPSDNTSAQMNLYDLYTFSLSRTRLTEQFSHSQRIFDTLENEFVVGQVTIDADGIDRVSSFRFRTRSVDSGIAFITSDTESSFARLQSVSIHYTAQGGDNALAFLMIELHTTATVLNVSSIPDSIQLTHREAKWSVDPCAADSLREFERLFIRNDCIAQSFKKTAICQMRNTYGGRYEMIVPVPIAALQTTGVAEVYMLVSGVTLQNDKVLTRMYAKTPISTDSIQHECQEAVIISDIRRYVTLEAIVGISGTQVGLDALTRTRASLQAGNITFQTSSISVVGSLITLVLKSDSRYFDGSSAVVFKDLTGIYFSADETHETFQQAMDPQATYLDAAGRIAIPAELAALCSPPYCYQQTLVIDSVIVNAKSTVDVTASGESGYVWLQGVLGKGDYVDKLGKDYWTLLQTNYATDPAARVYMVSPLFYGVSDAVRMCKHIIFIGTVTSR